MGWNGGYLGYDATPKGDGVAPGIWGMRDARLAIKRGTWPGPDPYFANVVALLHFDGTDGSTTFTDVKGHTFTANGNAQIDTAQSLFGGASGLFDGSGDYLSTPDSADWDFGTGDFTLELAVRFNALPVNSSMTFLSTYQNSSSGWSFQYRNDSGGGSGNRLQINMTGDTTNLTFAWSPSAATWYRVSLARSGTSVRAFVDGAQVGSTVESSANLSSAAALVVGQIGSGIHYFNGWMDEVRITKGVARYAANYLPWAAQFPDR